MAFSFNGGNGGTRRRSRGGGTLADINVTPFVDVVLVLLIIFMLTAHVMEFGIEVDVPKTQYVKDTAQELPVITITKEGATTLNGADVNINELVPTIRKRFGANGNAVYLRADKDTVWDPIVQVMAELGAAKPPIAVNVVTQPEDTAAKRRR